MKNNNLKLDLLSAINPDILDRVDIMRERYMFGGKKKRNNAWLPWVAMAACLCIIVGAMFAFLPSLLSTGKQVPIYQGMTVSSENPLAGNESMVMTPNISSLSHQKHPSISLLNESDTKPTQPKPTPPHEKHTEALTDGITDGVTEAITEAPPHDFDATSGVYYAKGNQDFYITVHISNPDNFEILSFTLNGVKYSSYMFEQGSNMENLVLKCNVGDAEGIVTYTIDAIKYVDGENIKDVRMEGDRTIEIYVYPENQPTVTMGDVIFDHVSLTITPTITDELNLIADSEGTLSVMLYNGDTLVEEKAFASGDTLNFINLAPETTYTYKIAAVYDAVDGRGKTTHILLENTITTQPVITFENVTIEGLTATFDMHGVDTITALALYEGDTLYRELTVDTRAIEHLPMDREISLVATYTVGETVYKTTYILPVIHASEGLYIVDGIIVGIGTCSDTVLYLNHPIKASAFESNDFITAVYLGEGVTDIGDLAFHGCPNLEKVIFLPYLTHVGDATFGSCTKLNNIILPDSLTNIANEMFSGCVGLTNITIPDSVESIGTSAFSACNGLTDLPVMNGVKIIGNSAFSECQGLTSITIPESVEIIGNSAFWSCRNLTSITILEGVTTIDRGAFGYCAITEISIPQSATNVASDIITGCPNITNFVIPHGATIIENDSFSECISLKTLVIPNSVIAFHVLAFADNRVKITDVYFMGTQEEWDNIKWVIDDGTEINHDPPHITDFLGSTTIHYNYNPEAES